jgi:hypothetical protein
MNAKEQHTKRKSTAYLNWLIIPFSFIAQFILHDAISAQSTQATFGEGFTLDGRSPLLEYSSQRRLRIEVVAVAEGLKVVKIYENSPVLRLRSPGDRKLVASMEVNDVIQSINGVPLRTGEDLVQELQTVGSECEIEVLDIRTNNLVTWMVKPADTFTPKMAAADQIDAPAKIHIIIAAATNDKNLGQSIELSVGNLQSMFHANVDPHSLNLQVLQGANCNAFGIASAIANLKVGFQDGIMIYYLGHGAYDATLVDQDPFHGHFFDFPGTDLLRRTVWGHLDSKPVRLRILISDACNNSSQAKLKVPPARAKSFEPKTVTRSTNLEWLLLGYSGDLDINAASRDEFAWYSNDLGGWFTESFVPVAGRNSDWGQVTEMLPREVNRVFQKNKRHFLGLPATTATVPIELLRSQSNLTPIISADLVRDDSPPFPQDVERTLNIQIAQP